MKNKTRIIFQSIILLLILYVAIRPALDSGYTADFEAYCPFGGISSLFSKLEMGTMSCSMSEVQVMMGIGLLVAVILFGKLFCSYICPIGAVSEWLGKLGAKLKIRMEMPKYLDRPLRSLKYILLFLTIYFTMTSSELFCKEFEPYFAAVNLFGNTDINLVYAIAAFIITVVGAVIFRLFWCKYLCPLSAMSNIFLNVLPVSIAIIVFILINAFIGELSFIWLLAAIVLIGLISEIGFMRSFILPAAKITRDPGDCTSCGICEASCPQGIEITKYDVITHADCNLCTDCVYSCPVKQSLTINNKKATKYLAPIATVVLVLVSLGFSTQIEFKTLSDRWGNFNEVENVAVLKKEGLKNVKCYGSAKSLSSQLHKVQGIHGLDAYAASHTIEIYYDADKLEEVDVKKTIFSPAKQKVRIIKDGSLDSLSTYEYAIDKLFDRIDYNNLFYALREDEGVFGFLTHFGEPVTAVFFYDENKTTPEKIKEEVTADIVEIKKRSGTTELELSFEINEEGKPGEKMSVYDYEKMMYHPFDRKFNKYNLKDTLNLSVLVYNMPEAGKTITRRYLPYLTSHLSKDSSIVRLRTTYHNGSMAICYFDHTLTDVENVKSTLSDSTLSVSYSNGTEKDVKSPFNINPNGEVFKLVELPEEYK